MAGVCALCFAVVRNTLELNSLWPSDAIWRHRSGSTLAQVMACCLTAPSHYLNQCWLNSSVALWHSAENDFTRNAQDIYAWYQFENYWFKTSNTSSRGQRVNHIIQDGFTGNDNEVAIWLPKWHFYPIPSEIPRRKWVQKLHEFAKNDGIMDMNKTK